MIESKKFKSVTIREGFKSNTRQIIVNTDPRSRESIELDPLGVTVKIRAVGTNELNCFWYPMHRVVILGYTEKL
jgi:hypothetical protein